MTGLSSYVKTVPGWRGAPVCLPSSRFFGGLCVKVLARRNSALFLLSLIIMTLTVLSQELGSGPMIQGIVRSKQTPLPGAIVTAVDPATSKAVTAITEVNGQFQLKVAGPGKYHVTVDMTLFMSQSADVEITDATKPVQKDFDMNLMSRTERAAAPPAPAVEGGRGGGRGGRGQAEVAANTEPQQEQDPFADLQRNPSITLLPGMNPDAATESVAFAGTTAAPQFSGAFDPRNFDQGNFNQGNFNGNFNGNNNGFGDQGGNQGGNRGGFGGDNNGGGGGNRGGGG